MDWIFESRKGKDDDCLAAVVVKHESIDHRLHAFPHLPDQRYGWRRDSTVF